MMEAYLQALPSAVIAVDRSCNVTFLNSAAETLLGISAALAGGKSLAQLPGFNEGTCDLCEKIMASLEAMTLTEQELRLPSHHRTVTMHLNPVIREGASGKAVSVEQVLITIDKSGLDHLTASQWKKESTFAAGVMAAMLAHEVKNPLSGIRGAAQLLKEEVSEEYMPLADLICRETDRIRDLLDQVEIFSGEPTEPPSPVNIHEVLQYVITVAANGFAPQVAFKELYDPSIPEVAGHRDLLVQLFLNLVKNAAEALNGRPDAAITLGTHYRSGYRIKHGASGETLPLPIAVTITDNGPGVPEAIRARLFEPFVSSKEEGRGLGLAIVAKIASDLGAVAELDKDYDTGTRFTVWLPCVR